METMITCSENNLRSNLATLLVIVEFASWLQGRVGNYSAIGIARDFNDLSKSEEEEREDRSI
jgi:hypothetical protein